MLSSGVRDIESFIACVKQATGIDPNCQLHLLHYIHNMKHAFPMDRFEFGLVDTRSLSLHLFDLGLIKYILRDLRTFLRHKASDSCLTRLCSFDLQDNASWLNVCESMWNSFPKQWLAPTDSMSFLRFLKWVRPAVFLLSIVPSGVTIHWTRVALCTPDSNNGQVIQRFANPRLARRLCTKHQRSETCRMNSRKHRRVAFQQAFF
jgi:hypothetical protein